MNDLTGSTIFVTGASGFIGTHLVNRLVKDKSIQLITLSRQRNEYLEREGVMNIRASLAELSRDTWKQAGISNIDFVFHFAAYIPKSTDNANNLHEIQEANISGMQSMLESLPGTPRKIIFSSTLDVYGQATEYIDEQSPIHPIGLYGASKFYGEHLVRTFCRQAGIGFAILRIGHIFGPGEEAFKKIVPVAIQNVMHGIQPVVYGTGSAERDLFYVEDAVEAAIRAATLPEAELGPINIVRGDSLPIRKIVEMILELSNSLLTISYLSEKPDGHSLRLNNQKMKELLGEWEFISYREGLKREIEAFQKTIGRIGN